MRPRGLQASGVLKAATDAHDARARVERMERARRDRMRESDPCRCDPFESCKACKATERGRRALARARIAECELHDAYEAAIARWEWWDLAVGPGHMLGFRLRADGHPGLWSTNPLRDRLRDRSRIGLGI
jgi:hypothetical protein